MSLQERSKLHLDDRLDKHLKETRNTNKSSVVIKDILTHQAGLTPFISCFPKLLNEKRDLDPQFFSKSYSKLYSVPISSDLFGHYSLIDSVWKWVLDSKVSRKKNRRGYKRYKYSDIGFDMLRVVAENIVEDSLYRYMDRNFYNPLGLQTMTYLPLSKFKPNRIVPSNIDDYRGFIRGYVHDPRSSLVGGVAGHAGLFSDVLDIAILMQMHLQGGFYGGKRYFQQKTIDLFNSRPYVDNSNRRAIGWDKPTFKKGINTSVYCSDITFGHTGFTGTCVWVDPYYDLIYVFLSNRTYPDMENQKIIQYNIRTCIQDIIYESIIY